MEAELTKKEKTEKAEKEAGTENIAGAFGTNVYWQRRCSHGQRRLLLAPAAVLKFLDCGWWRRYLQQRQ